MRVFVQFAAPTIGLALMLLSAGPAWATGSQFAVTSKSGTTTSYAITGYEFSSGLTPKIGAAGTVEVDVKVASSASKTALKVGPLRGASLHVVATLPKKINTTYKFADPKITSATFVTGSLGAVGVVDLSYTNLTS